MILFFRFLPLFSSPVLFSSSSLLFDRSGVTDWFLIFLLFWSIDNRKSIACDVLFAFDSLLCFCASWCGLAESSYLFWIKQERIIRGVLLFASDDSLLLLSLFPLLLSSFFWSKWCEWLLVSLQWTLGITETVCLRWFSSSSSFGLFACLLGFFFFFFYVFFSWTITRAPLSLLPFFNDSSFFIQFSLGWCSSFRDEAREEQRIRRRELLEHVSCFIDLSSVSVMSFCSLHFFSFEGASLWL